MAVVRPRSQAAKRPWAWLTPPGPPWGVRARGSCSPLSTRTCPPTPWVPHRPGKEGASGLGALAWCKGRGVSWPQRVAASPLWPWLQLIEDKKVLGEKCEALVAELKQGDQRRKDREAQMQEQHELVSHHPPTT